MPGSRSGGAPAFLRSPAPSRLQSRGYGLRMLCPDRLAEVRERIEAACAPGGPHAGRGDGSWRSPRRTPRPRWRRRSPRGSPTSGENRVQELEEKVAEVGRDAVRWHLIGHLQRNKARRALPLFDLLHSLDSLRLARKLSDEAGARRARTRARAGPGEHLGRGDASAGFEPARADRTRSGEICELPGLRVEGLMTMAPLHGRRARCCATTFAADPRAPRRRRGQVPGFHRPAPLDGDEQRLRDRGGGGKHPGPPGDRPVRGARAHDRPHAARRPQEEGRLPPRAARLRAGGGGRLPGPGGRAAGGGGAGERHAAGAHRAAHRAAAGLPRRGSRR